MNFIVKMHAWAQLLPATLNVRDKFTPAVKFQTVPSCECMSCMEAVVMDSTVSSGAAASATWRDSDFPSTPPVWSWSDASLGRERRVGCCCVFF